MRVTKVASTRQCAVCERTLLMGERAVSFALIWAALVLYTLDNLRAQRSALAPVAPRGERRQTAL